MAMLYFRHISEAFILLHACIICAYCSQANSFIVGPSHCRGKYWRLQKHHSSGTIVRKATDIYPGLRVGLHLRESIQVRDWRSGEGEEIFALVASAAGIGFDPEGPPGSDVGSETAIRRSYASDDGGCLLVATTADDNGGNRGGRKIVGTAALVVGTPVTAYGSGGTLASPERTTGAVRRVCVSSDAVPDDAGRKFVLRSLMEVLEGRAARDGAGELIALAYVDNGRPGADLFLEMGYEEIPERLDGVAAVQFRKVIHPNTVESYPRQYVQQSEKNRGTEIAIAATLFAFLLVAIVGVVNFMGLDLIPGNDNGGIGTPLSVQELERLRQDERLQRTNLDGKYVKGERQWEDLGPEEIREETALMKIIQGQGIRAQ